MISRASSSRTKLGVNQKEDNGSACLGLDRIAIDSHPGNDRPRSARRRRWSAIGITPIRYPFGRSRRRSHFDLGVIRHRDGIQRPHGR
jgi:hypothetical protein